jgi:carbon storage regulator
VREHGHDGIPHAVELIAVKKRNMEEPESGPIQWKIGFERTQGASTEVDPSSQHFETKEQAMLVLSRKLNEKIVIDGGIVVTVVKIDRNQVRLGIEAPANVRIFREEIAAADGHTSSGRPVEVGV